MISVIVDQFMLLKFLPRWSQKHTFLLHLLTDNCLVWINFLSPVLLFLHLYSTRRERSPAPHLPPSIHTSGLAIDPRAAALIANKTDTSSLHLDGLQCEELNQRLKEPQVVQIFTLKNYFHGKVLNTLKNE